MKVDVPYFLAFATEEAKKTPAHLLHAPGAEAVGAVLVPQGEQAIVTAYSGEFGEGWHAEQVLFAKAKKQGIDTKNATVVLTMEPCGCRSDPNKTCCAQLLIDAGVSQVYFDKPEPKPDFSSLIKMQRAGLSVNEC